MSERRSNKKARSAWAFERMRYGAVVLTVVCLLVVGVFVLPLALNPSRALPSIESNVRPDMPADDASGYVVSDGVVAPAADAVSQDERIDAEGAGDTAGDYEIVTDDGIVSEHQGGVVIVRLADGCSVDEFNEGIKGLSCLAPQTVAAEDLALGYAKLRLADGVGVPGAVEALGASNVVGGAQPNYVYRLDEVDASEDPDKPDLQAGSIITEPDPIEVEVGDETHETRQYYDFVTDPMAWNQMVIMTVRLREAYCYTHDSAGNPTAWSNSDQRPAIAILDTGCDIYHEDLQANVVGYYDAVNRCESDKYIGSHGTHVAGIAAAVTNNGTGITGVSLNAKIVSVKVFKQDAEHGVYADSADILAGYEYVISNAQSMNIRVANMSLGATTARTDNDDKALLEAVDRAYEKGILTTISAGNDALSEGGAYSDFPSDFAPNAIGVIDCGVSGLTEDFYAPNDPEHYLATKLWLTRDSYSNYNMAGTMNKQLSALGSSVMSTTPRGHGDVVNLSTGGADITRSYGRKDGTSMASPCVAGVAALALSVNPGLTVDELKSLLYSSAVDIDASSCEHAGPGSDPDPMDTGFDPYTGFGAIDAYNAVVAADTGTYLSGKTLAAKGGTVTLSIPSKAGATGVTWRSSDAGVARVESSSDSTATIRMCGGGQAIVLATCTVPAAPSAHGAEVGEGVMREVTICAVVASYDAAITGPDAVQYGGIIELGLNAAPTNGTWEWTSSNPNVKVDGWTDEETGKVKVVGLKVDETATITATLTSDRSIKATKTVRVDSIPISGATVSLSQTSFQYDGTAKRPGVTVKMGAAVLREGADYTVSYSNNVEPSSAARVIVTGMGNYAGSVSRTFTILPASAPAPTTFAPAVEEPSDSEKAHGVQYRTHVQNVGWQDYVRDGAMSGTSGRALRLEGINVELADYPYPGSIRYCTHIQNIGWESDWKYDGDMSGTSGRSLRLEAIRIELTGDMAQHYDVYYRVHCQNLGWMSWAKNGAQAGSAGYAYRLEGIEVRLVPKGASAPGSTAGAFRNKAGSLSGVPDSESLVLYRTHVQNDGWQNYMRDGEVSGTSGRSLRLEGINVQLGGAAGAGGIQYRTHVQNIGWQDWKYGGAMAGTSGQALRLEAIEIALYGDAAQGYDVYYRVHCQNIGWMDWAKNGERAGTAGYAYRLEGIQVQLVPKGSAPPGSTANAFRQR